MTSSRHILASLRSAAIVTGMMIAIACAPTDGQAPSQLQEPAAKVVVEPDPPHVCDFCDRLNAHTEPFQVYGNTYYVGTAMISSVR